MMKSERTFGETVSTLIEALVDVVEKGVDSTSEYLGVEQEKHSGVGAGGLRDLPTKEEQSDE